MENTIYNTAPSTYCIRFTGSALPQLFQLYDEAGSLYYFRYLDGNTAKISLNLPAPGMYYSDTDFAIASQVPIIISGFRIKLPKPQRNFGANLDNISFTTVSDQDLQHTPARMYYETGSILVSESFWGFPEPIREFIICHELGHLFYENEFFADLFAVKNYLMAGNNHSMAFYSLSHILHPGQENENRICKIYAVLILDGRRLQYSLN